MDRKDVKTVADVTGSCAVAITDETLANKVDFVIQGSNLDDFRPRTGAREGTDYGGFYRNKN